MALVTHTVHDGVATLAIDDGKVNVVSLALVTELNAALDRAVSERTAVVIAGRAATFSAGFDIKVLGAGGADALKLLMGGFTLSERLLSFPHPVVAACTGHAIAMGAFLLLSVDERIGADGAFRIVANETAIGLVMPRYGVEICRQRLAPAHFQRVVINAQPYSPQEAVAAGFLDKVVPEAQVVAEAQAAAARLAQLPRSVHTATKLRARETALEAVRAAIKADKQELLALMPR